MSTGSSGRGCQPQVASADASECGTEREGRRALATPANEPMGEPVGRRTRLIDPRVHTRAHTHAHTSLTDVYAPPPDAHARAHAVTSFDAIKRKKRGSCSLARSLARPLALPPTPTALRDLHHAPLIYAFVWGRAMDFSCLLQGNYG